MPLSEEKKKRGEKRAVGDNRVMAALWCDQHGQLWRYAKMKLTSTPHGGTIVGKPKLVGPVRNW